jgi:hypothetical protein
LANKPAAVTSITPALTTYLNKSIQIYFRNQPAQCEKHAEKKEKTGFP